MIKKTKLKTPLFLVILAYLVLSSYSNSKKNTQNYLYNEGEIFGTFYHIQYAYKDDIQKEIQTSLNRVDYSLSTYKPQSTLSKINQNIDVKLDSDFIQVFKRGQEVSKQTHGAFDMTVASLVNVWGFGFKDSAFPDSTEIDSLMQYVGYKNIKLEKGKIIKKNPNIMIDASAIAKGYGVDAVANLFESKGIQNYLIEIGGEIRLKGHSSKNKKWSVGIDKPKDDIYNADNEVQEIIALDNGAIATSGDYRQFYFKNGHKYSHTVNPKTGYPVSHNVLSTTVYTNDCASADAYATSFMVMELDSTKAFAKKHPELGIYIIYAKDSTENKVWMNNKFQRLILK